MRKRRVPSPQSHSWGLNPTLHDEVHKAMLLSGGSPACESRPDWLRLANLRERSEGEHLKFTTTRGLPWWRSGLESAC